LESSGRAGSGESSLEHLHQTVEAEMAKQRGKKREGKKEISDFNSESPGRTIRIEREQLGTFSSYSSGQHGNETNYHKKQTEREKETGHSTRFVKVKKARGEKESGR
jgi:hypothetical protein